MSESYRDRPRMVWLLAGLLLLGITQQAQADRERDREARQAELDARCEQARERKLAPLRAQYVEECVREKHYSTRRECEVFYADYGARSGNRAPLFYDLPECVEAYDFQNSQRRR